VVGIKADDMAFAKRSDCSALIPQYATQYSAGVDLRANIQSPMKGFILPGKVIKVSTGIRLDIRDKNCFAMITPRSGLATQYGIVLANTVGIIDADYHGEIIVALQNNGRGVYTVFPGDKIAQMIFIPIIRPAFEVIESLPDSERGEGGFGSTGV
jgi:dUTP pyrophosphatase